LCVVRRQEEGHQDVGIWLSRKQETSWSPPVLVADGVQADGKRYPCWNPVLFHPYGGEVLRFYKGRAKSKPVVGDGSAVAGWRPDVG